MFVQVIEGRVRDAGGLERQWQTWMQELAPHAVGWVGSTDSITPEHRFIAAVRFESAEAAARNSDRPEQGRWWADTEKALEGATFSESSDYSATGAPSDDAGFVQIMRGRVADRSRVEQLEAAFDEMIGQHRPDLLGGYHLWLPDDAFVDVNYFTSEDEARVGETRKLPTDLAERFAEWQSLLVDVRWFDLPDPWLDSAPR
jgi:hypothetical protein